MEVSAFQERLQALCRLAEEGDHRLTTAQVQEYFRAAELDRDQLIRILQFLKSRGITIETADQEPKIDAASEAQAVFPGTRKALTGEDMACLREYQENYGGFSLENETLALYFADLSQGKPGAKDALVLHYLPVCAELAAEYNSEEILLADLIQEVSLVLVSVLTSPGDAVRDDIWLREKLQEGIREILTRQTEVRQQDASLVSRVERLEEAVRELTDEEDKELKFTVDELAVILDMKVDEIRDVLRLTGDDRQ